MVSRADIEGARPFQLFRNGAEKPADGTRHVLISGNVSLSEDGLSKLRGLGVEPTDPDDPEEVQRDDEACQGTQADDVDACLAYIRLGGAVVFVPDCQEDPRYGRYLAVRPRGS